MKGEQKFIVLLVFLLCTIIAIGTSYFVISQQDLKEKQEKIETLEKELEAIKNGQPVLKEHKEEEEKENQKEKEVEKKETTDKGTKESQTVKKEVHRVISPDVQKQLQKSIDMSATQGSTNEYVTRGQFVKLLSVLLENTTNYKSTIAPPESYVYHSESNQENYSELQNINYFMNKHKMSKPLTEVFGENYKSDNFVTDTEVKSILSNFGIKQFNGLNSYTSKNYVDKKNVIAFLSSIPNEVNVK